MNRTKQWLATLAVAITSVPLAADVFRMPEGLTSIETVEVGAPGNAPDDTGYGAVAYPFRIGKFEVTAAQYAEFLNAVAKVEDPHELRNNNTEETAGCGIVLTGQKGNFRYTVAKEFANRPVNHVNFWDACRFCNWLHNGQGTGDTETGAYTLNGYKGTDGRKIRRNRGARWFVPSEDEWYKSAYYDPHKPGGGGYWDYPTRSDARGDRERNSPHGSNSYYETYLDTKYYILEVGSFGQAASGFGTFDQAGNVMEWNEAMPRLLQRGLRGGGYCTSDGGRNVRPVNREVGLWAEKEYVGFRVAAAADNASTGPHDGSEVTVPDDPPLLAFARRPWRDAVTGRPFFPMGWYAWGSDAADLDQLQREGANTILFVNAPTDVDRGEEQLKANLAYLVEYLDHAQRHDIKVIVQNGWREGFSQGVDAAFIDRAERMIRAICNHPALLAYQMYDEPEFRTENGLNEHVNRETKGFVDSIGQARDLIRGIDTNPHHSIQVVFNLVPMSAYNWFLPSIDGFQIDRYPIWATSAHMSQRGDWGPLMNAWTISHGAREVVASGQLNPVPVLQGIGLSHDEARDGTGYYWRNPTYEETRYMAYSCLTVGGWGFLHWIRDSSCDYIKQNVARLHHEFRQLIPALQQSYEHPPFSVRHGYMGLTRNYLTDSIPDISTLELEDERNYYLIASNNSGSYDDVTFFMKLPHMSGAVTQCQATVLNEGWSRTAAYDASTQEWVIPKHPMCFGDVNVWVIPKSAESN